MPEIESPPIPPVKDLRTKIEGLLPKNTQARVLGGIALLMVVIIMFSGRKTERKAPKDRTAPVPAAVDANQERIQAYRAQIEEETRKLALEQARLAQAKDALGAPSSPPIANYGTAASGYPAPGVPVGVHGYTPQAAGENALALEPRKRQERSLFASNIALSYRQHPPPSGQQVSRTGSDRASSPSSDEVQPDDPVKAGVKKYRLFEGTILETVVINRLDNSFSGPVNCMVTTDVHSTDQRHLLIPQGTRVLGRVHKVEGLGDQRLAVSFHRMIRPDGFSLTLDQFQGLNQIGETGLRDKVNHHYLQLFGVSFGIGILAGFSQANTRYGADASGIDSYRQGVASSLSQSSMHILDRFLNVLPTFTIREGHRVKVYLSRDLLLPAYEEDAVSNGSLVEVP
jgi:type IV secretory pathway VirB10-like protein